MNKEDYKFQFDFWTNTLGLSHKLPFEDVWRLTQEYEAKKLEKLNKERWNKNLAELNDNYPSKAEFREMIVRVEERIKSSSKGLTGAKLNRVNPLKHRFGDNLYIREIFNPKGELLVTKIHKTTHPFFLMKGEMTIFDENKAVRIKAPFHGITNPGTKRIIYTHKDCIFITVHSTKSKDLRKIENNIISKNYEIHTEKIKEAV